MRFFSIGRAGPAPGIWHWLSDRQGYEFKKNPNPRTGNARRYARKRDAIRALRRIEQVKGSAFADGCHICPFDPE